MKTPEQFFYRILTVLVGFLALTLFLLLGLPILILIGRALVGYQNWDGMAGHLGAAVFLSLATTLISLSLIVLFGTPLGYVLARFSFPFKSVWITLIELPIVLPPVVAGLALLMTFGRRGLLGAPLDALGITLPFSITAVIIAQVFVSAPYYIRAAQVQFQAIPRELEQAASLDGAQGWQVFRFVTLPLSLRGLFSGAVLSWARALGEFGATILFAGNLQGRTQTMPLLVYGALERDLNAALWAGVILIGMAILALGLMRWLTRTIELQVGLPPEV
jgi:molybdate transport system permease protein